MTRSMTVLAAIFLVLSVALTLACIWTSGTEHTSFTTAAKLGATAGVSFMLAVAAGVGASISSERNRKDEEANDGHR